MRKKGQSLWDERKKVVGVSLTPTAIAGLDQLAKEFGENRSEFIEKVARRIFKVSAD